MSPRPSTMDSVDGFLVKLVLQGQGRLWFTCRTSLSDGSHYLLGQFRVPVSLPFCSVLYARLKLRPFRLAVLSALVLHVVSGSSQKQVARVNTRRVIAFVHYQITRWHNIVVQKKRYPR